MAEEAQIERGKQMLLPLTEEMGRSISTRRGVQLEVEQWVGSDPVSGNVLLEVTLNGKRRRVEVPEEWVADYPANYTSHDPPVRQNIQAKVREKLERLVDDFLNTEQGSN